MTINVTSMYSSGHTIHHPKLSFALQWRAQYQTAHLASKFSLGSRRTSFASQVLDERGNALPARGGHDAESEPTHEGPASVLEPVPDYAMRNLRPANIRPANPVTSIRVVAGSGTEVVGVNVQVPEAEALGMIGVPVGSATIAMDAPPIWGLPPKPLVITPIEKFAPTFGPAVLANHL